MTTTRADSPDLIDTVQCAIAGDELAFERLVEHHAGMVTGVAYSVLGDFARSEDVGQEAFLEAWKKRKSLSDPAKFAGWICSIARHRALDMRRKALRQAGQSADLAITDPPTSEPSAADVAARQEEKTLVWNTLDTLPAKYREGRDERCHAPNAIMNRSGFRQ